MAGVDVWAAHFSLSRTPFTKSIPATKLFDRAAHAEAVARIHYCINEAALGVVVGDTGAGKTVALRAAVAALDRTKFTLVYLSNPSRGRRRLVGARPPPLPQGRPPAAAGCPARRRRTRTPSPCGFRDRRGAPSLPRAARGDQAV